MKMDVKIKPFPKCPLCGDTAITYLGTIPDLTQISYYRCDTCQTIRQSMIIAEEEDFYIKSYRQILYPTSTENISESEERTEEHRAEIQTQIILNKLSSFVPFSRGLDFGCGLGTLARALVVKGAVTTMYGVELNESYRQRANEKGVITTRYLAGLPVDKFDLVTMSHVLEHLSDPYPILTELVTSLNPGGLLFVEVPNGHSNRNAYRPWHPVVYTIDTLKLLFSRFESELTTHSHLYYPDSWQPIPENIVTIFQKKGEA